MTPSSFPLLVFIDTSSLRLGLYCILPLRKMRLLLPLLLRHPTSLVLGQTATNGARALGAQVKRQVFLVLVEDP